MTQKHPHTPKTLSLEDGEQAVINGALVTAHGPCMIEVAPGAHVFAGRGLSRQPVLNPHEELYFSILDIACHPQRLDKERTRLFGLLTEVVIQDRTHEAQKECAVLASALIAGATGDATRSAARLVSRRLSPSGRQIKQRSLVSADAKVPLVCLSPSDTQPIR